MQLPTVQAEKLIAIANLDWIDEIYRDSMPEEIIDSTDQTVALITEWLNEPDYYANVKFKGWNIGVEVQIFYKLNLDAEFEMMDAEIQFAELFKKNNWQIDVSRNHIEDPDTHQVSRVFYFSKKLMINKGD